MQTLDDPADIGRNVLRAIQPWLEEARRGGWVDLAGLERCIDGIERLLEPAPHASPALAAVRGGLAPWQVARVKALVEARLADRLTTSDLAAAAGLSACHFARAFKVSRGLSPHQYVMRRRIERGKHLMATTAASLAEIGLEIGFADQAHFSRVFRHFERESPSAWRRHRRPARGASISRASSAVVSLLSPAVR